jgi:hypothetical protein
LPCKLYTQTLGSTPYIDDFLAVPTGYGAVFGEDMVDLMLAKSSTEDEFIPFFFGDDGGAFFTADRFHQFLASPSAIKASLRENEKHHPIFYL